MLKHLPDTSLETLLNILNYIWTTGKFPKDWTLATIIPIPKPGKDPAEPNNYIPNKKRNAPLRTVHLSGISQVIGQFSLYQCKGMSGTAASHVFCNQASKLC